MPVLRASLATSFCFLVGSDECLARALQAELVRSGVRTEASSELLTPAAVPARATAVVWFADDYPAIAVLLAVRELRARRPGLRMVLITRWPEDLTGLLVSGVADSSAVVLGRPAASLDVLRALGRGERRVIDEAFVGERVEEREHVGQLLLAERKSADQA